MECLIEIGFQVENVYKIILDCEEKNIRFYEKVNICIFINFF